jgi:outer membrane receptor protein involved in Fe transport
MNTQFKRALSGATCLRGAAVVSALVALSSPVAAFAQDAPADCVDGSGAACGKEATIVVTGSRIRRPDNYKTPDPVQVITREETTQAGFNSTADVLQSTSVTNGTAQINNSFGGFVTAGGPGANTLSLRGFGATRTLILLNGRRVAPAGSRGSVGSADLNVLPSAMIDHIEVLNGGASSIYGSDAVAGVVNIITRDKVKGLQLEAQLNAPDNGAGLAQRYSVVFGYNTDRLRLSGSLEYYDRGAMKVGDVDWTQCQISYRKLNASSAPGTGDFIDPKTGQPKCYPTGSTGESGVTINTIGVPNFAGSIVDLAAGIPTGYGTLPTSAGFGSAPTTTTIGGPANNQQVCNRFRPDSTAAGALPGWECVGGGALSLGIRDTFSPALLNNDLISPARVYTGFFQGAYDTGVLGDAQVYAELLLNRRESSQTQSRQFTIDYPWKSPLVPASLTFPVRFLPPQASNPGVDVGVRVFADYGNYGNRQKVDFIKATGGLRGSLPADWRYDLTFSKSWSDSDYTSDLILTNRLNQSLDVVASGSGFACRDTSNGCIAAPALTPAVVGGQFPADWFNWVTQPVTGHTAYRESTVSLDLDGKVFDLPGGPAQVALGFEYRKSSIDDTPALDSQNGNLYNFTSSSITRGSDSVWEVYGEAELPLVRDTPGIEDLTFTVSGRYTHYKSYGGQWTYKFGGRYAPITWLAFRGSYGTSYRAPALFEQYLGATSGFQSSAGDPCNNLTSASNPVRVANCASEGIGTGFSATSSIAVLQKGGAASGLKAETSKNWTIGAVIEPSLGAFGDLSFSADYFNILVSNGVSQLGYSTILQQCYDDPDFRAESICSYVTRNSAAPYNLTVVTGYVNISTAKVSGYDFTMRYAVPVGPGKLTINADLTKFENRFNQTLPTDPVTNLIGTLNNPRWTGTLDVRYKINRWDFRWGLDWIQGTNSSASYLGLSQATRDTYVFEAPDYYLHSASVRYRGDHYGITVGVRNLFDREPPQISSGAYNRIGNSPLYSGYDFAGRTFFVNLSAAF